MKAYLPCFLVLLSSLCFGQNLLKERIRSIPANKKAIFLDQGIFHKNQGAGTSKLLSTRHSYVKSRGYERFVLDFSTTKVPKAYVYASGQTKKFYIDLFNTTLGPSIESLGDSKYLSSIDYFPISPAQLSLELAFKSHVSVDLFYLEGKNGQGRLVLDVKE